MLKKEQFLSPDGVPPTITPLHRPQLQVQSGIEQMRQALDDDKRTRDVRKQKLQKEKLLFSTLENALGEEQQKRARLEEELSRVKNAGNERARTLENQLRDTSRMCELKKAEVREKVAAVNNLQVLLEENQQEKSGIKNQLSQQQKVCTKLEERLQAEQVSSQSLQLQLEANELIIRELRLKVEQGREQRTALEQTVGRLQLQFAEEKDRHASIERDLQSALSTTQEEMSEVLRSGTRDWILLRKEVTLGRKVLGKGAWGIVNEGMFRGCKVAVKKIHDLILSDLNRRLFEREMNIASRCRHPNLLQFIGATNDDGSPLFVTELLDTCLRRLLSERELTPKEVLNLTLDIAKGLNYLHLNKPLPIIHRDISSANVLLWRRGECWRAKLSDYGAANFMRRCMTANKGAIIYSAPEAFTPRQSPKVKFLCGFPIVQSREGISMLQFFYCDDPFPSSILLLYPPLKRVKLQLESDNFSK